MKLWSGTARKLIFAFASLVAMFGLATWFAMAGLDDLHEGLHGVKREEERVRVALELASAVRDQYAHQAHTIILGNATHVPFYEQARERVLSLTALARKNASSADERAWVDDIERATHELAEIFRGQLVPAVLAGDRETIHREHGRAQELVSLIEERADRLTRSAETSINTFEEHAGAVEHATVRWTLVFLLGSMVFAVAVGLYIGRSVTRPIATLEAGAARLAEGDLSARIAIDSPDEFGRLARQFNTMTEALERHQEALVQSEKLAGIGRLAAGVAHEINNPLGVILGYTRILQKKAEGSLAEDLKVIEDEAVRCQQIVEELLDLSRPIKVTGESVDLRALCEEVAERVLETASLAGVRLTVEGAGAAIGHPVKLRQVVLNLVKNAAEAAGPSGEVQVRIEATLGGAIAVSVRDTGAGIAPGDRGRLFEPFFTTKPHGTGLGLALSRAIAQAHGGEIEVEPAPERGAVFTLRLPPTAEGRA